MFGNRFLAGIAIIWLIIFLTTVQNSPYDDRFITKAEKVYLEETIGSNTLSKKVGFLKKKVGFGLIPRLKAKIKSKPYRAV